MNMEKSKSRGMKNKKHSNTFQKNTLDNYFGTKKVKDLCLDTSCNKQEDKNIETLKSKNKNGLMNISKEITSFSPTKTVDSSVTEIGRLEYVQNKVPNVSPNKFKAKDTSSRPSIRCNKLSKKKELGTNVSPTQFEGDKEKNTVCTSALKRKHDETTEKNEFFKSNMERDNDKTPTKKHHNGSHIQKPNLSKNVSSYFRITNEPDNHKTGREVSEIHSENPILFSDDEVEIQFRSPIKVPVVDEILYQDDDVVIQFQSPKKKHNKSGEYLMGEGCSFTGISHRLSPTKEAETSNLISGSGSESTTFPDDTIFTLSQKRIQGTDFKKAIFALCFEKFGGLDDSDTAKSEDQIVPPVELQSFGNKELFVVLDNDVSNWETHVLLVACLYMSPEVFFRGDVLRVFFYYILNGPDVKIMLDVKEILFRHFDLHPPYLETLRNCYLNLLFIAYIGNNFNFPNNIIDDGVWHHVIEQLETIYKIDKCSEDDSETDCEDPETKTDEEKTVYPNEVEPVTFELLEQRYLNHEPLLDIESNRALKTIDSIANFDWNKEEDVKINETELLQRLVVALKLMLQLLQTDFKNCVSKHKQCIIGKNPNQATLKPLVQYLTNEVSYSKLLKLYFKTEEQDLWFLLSQAFELMAENTRIFHSKSKTRWLFPLIDDKCVLFADGFFQLFKNNTWDEEEELRRLRMLEPPWFRQQVTMALLAHRFHFKMKTDLKGVVELMHSKITNNKNEHQSTNESEEVQECTVLVNKTNSPDKAKNVQKLLKKKNKYGETHLHILCKQKKSDLPNLRWFISLPEVDLNAADNIGWTPLHEAIASKSLATEKTRILLTHQPLRGQKPVDVGAQNKEGVTPLHDAVLNGNLDICRLLVEKGGYPLLFKHDCQGVTPFDLAKDNAEIIQYFKQVVEAKENMDLDLESTLHLENNSIELLRIACDASLANHDTLKLYKLLRADESLLGNADKMNKIVCDKDILLSYKENQNQFSKLRKLLQNLAQNKDNPDSLLLWNEHINPSQTDFNRSANPFQAKYPGEHFELPDSDED